MTTRLRWVKVWTFNVLALASTTYTDHTPCILVWTGLCELGSRGLLSWMIVQPPNWITLFWSSKFSRLLDRKQNLKIIRGRESMVPRIIAWNWNYDSDLLGIYIYMYYIIIIVLITKKNDNIIYIYQFIFRYVKICQAIWRSWLAGRLGASAQTFSRQRLASKSQLFSADYRTGCGHGGHLWCHGVRVLVIGFNQQKCWHHVNMLL